MDLRSFMIGLVASVALTPAAGHAGGGPHMGYKLQSRPEWIAFGEPGRPSDPARTVAITAADMKFTPNRLTVRLGKTIRFVVTNRDPIVHEFVIGDRAFQSQHMKEMERMPNMKMDEVNELTLQPGQTKVMLWRFTKPGTFVYACDIPGHAEAGMIGKAHVR